MIIPIENDKQLKAFQDEIGKIIDIGLGFKFRVLRIINVEGQNCAVLKEIPDDFKAECV